MLWLEICSFSANQAVMWWKKWLFEVELFERLLSYPSVSPGYWLPPEEHHKVRRTWVWSFYLLSNTEGDENGQRWMIQPNEPKMRFSNPWMGSRKVDKTMIKRDAPSTEQFNMQNRCFEVSHVSTKIYLKKHKKNTQDLECCNTRQMGEISLSFFCCCFHWGGKDCCLQLTGVVQYGLFLCNGPALKICLGRQEREDPPCEKSRVVRWVQSMFHWWMLEAQS